MKYIYHHLGLGDHFICNGLVRHYYEQFDELTIFCKNHLKSHIEFMYRDLNKLYILNFPDDQQVIEYIYQHNLHKDTILIGFDKILPYYKTHTFDEAFYLSNNLSFSIRFEKFYIQRDHLKEDTLYNISKINNKPYIFVHDDIDRGFKIREELLNTNKYTIIRNNKNFLVTDHLKILENAEEIHLMQSCFKDLINSYIFKKPKIFLHHYIRNYDNFANSKGLNKIETIY